jgi:AcrR family transcriptional regulator
VVLRRRPAGSNHPPVNARVRKRPNLLADEGFPPGPHQKRSINKRARLKAAGLALFGEKGYEATSINDIAGRAKLAVGGFYQHFRSKRQLLLALMDELLEHLSQIDLRPKAFANVQAGLRELLSAAFSRDLKYLGAYRAWQEATLSDPDLARKEAEIHDWTTARVHAVFQLLQQMPGARPDVDIQAMARVMDGFFWSLLARAEKMRKVELDQWIDTSSHLIFHAMFLDPPEFFTPAEKRKWPRHRTTQSR